MGCCIKWQISYWQLLDSQQWTRSCLDPVQRSFCSCALLSFRKGKFLHHYENYGATAKDIADWMKKWVWSLRMHLHLLKCRLQDVCCSPATFCLLSLTMRKLLLPLTSDVWHHLFRLLWSSSHLFLPLLTLTHLATGVINLHLLCSCLIFLSHLGSRSLPITPSLPQRLGSPASFSPPSPFPARVKGLAGKPRLSTELQPEGTEQGFHSYHRKRSETGRGCILATLSLAQRHNKSLPSPKLLLLCLFTAQQYDLEVVARLVVLGSKYHIHGNKSWLGLMFRGSLYTT